MINVLNMTKVVIVGNLPEFKFEFEFDNASTLPVKTYVLGQKTYLIAKDSTAKNLSTNTYYKYGGVDDKWVKVLPTPTPTPVDNTKITDNGDYSLINNDFIGYNEVSVDVSAEPTVLIEKSITENGTYNASDDDADGYSSVTVEVSGGGGGFDVIFYDYDGTIVTSYSAADFANLSAMPANPTHTGLTAQGWNWSLSDAKAYVAAYGKLNIGQMYITSDGKTRLYYVIPKDNLTLDLYLSLDEDTELDIDWGDNTEHTTWTSNDGDEYKEHEYSNGGRYTIAITVVSGGFSCLASGSDDYTLRKVEFGNGVTSIGNNAFYNCYALSSITIPNGVDTIDESAFYNSLALSSITIPNSVNTIGQYAFYYCFGLSSITIPNSVTSIGDSAFYFCSALSFITIPNGVDALLTESLASCSALSSITIPNSVTTINGSAFYECYALSSITIPDSVTTIGSYVFYRCFSLSSITFEPTTPPQISESWGLQLPTTCVIRVPQGTLSAYTSASNYPDPSQYIYEEY